MPMFVGAPARVNFTLPASAVVDATSVKLHFVTPGGTNLSVTAVDDGNLAYHASISSAQTTSGGGGEWVLYPEIVGADSASFPRYDWAQGVLCVAPGTKRFQ